MSNKFYQPGAQRAEKVQDLFATIAPRYDLINDLQSFWMHRGWKRRMITLAQLRPGQKALDLCCGTGDIAFRLAAAGGEVQGLDFSHAMLAVAEERKKAAGGTGPTFQQGDAMQVPFADNSFDVVTVGYGLRNLSRWEKGVAEMWRVAKPGGRILILEFGKPDNRLWQWLYFQYLRFFVPVFGKLFCGDSATHGYILESLQNYPAQHGVAAKLRELGAKRVEVINLLGGIMSIHVAEKP